VVRLIALVIGAFILVMALHRAAHALLLLFAAFFLALALNAPVSWVSRHLPGKKRGSRALATSVSFLIVVIVLGAFIASIVPPLVRQTENFINAAPHLVQDFRSQNSAVGKFIRHYHLQGQVNSFSTQLSDRLKHGGGTAFSSAKRVGSSVFSLITILVLTFMMLVEGPRRVEFIRELLPKRHKGVADRMSRDMYRVIKGYVNGQVILAALASLLITPALFILHISYPVALIVVIFTCGLIPMIGHTIGAVIVTIVALFHSSSSALIILAYYLLYQQLENYLIQPRIQANSTDMSPLLVFGAVVVGVSFGGLFGGLVAIPVAGCVRVAILEYLRSQRLIDAPVVTEMIHEATDTTK
jgi:predicted PurR-regulated permease PerM